MAARDREESVVPRVERAARSVETCGRPVVLAVSGGLDSMALLDGARGVAHGVIAAVATFDHGTGPHARAAADLVAEVCARLRMPCVVGHRRRGPETEASWREARWAFLRRVAAAHHAAVATAHTRDDQVETVLMRVLRGAGARGLAGLYADTGVVRPLLGLSRETLARYAAERGLRHVTDPSNESRGHLRNRLRHDLLPALRSVRPTIDEELLAVGARAAGWRRELDDVLSDLAVVGPAGLSIAAADLEGYDRESLGVLWPALAGRVGAVLDHRGTRRLAEFTISGASGRVIPLSGGWEVARLRDRFALRRRREAAEDAKPRPLSGDVRHGAWRFRIATVRSESLWTAALPVGAPLTVRAWQPADRIAIREGGTLRRVKRFFGDAGIAGPDRAGWPVVLAGDRIVWIPGVCRSDVAVERSGRPGVVYICERVHG